jgi:hypothetical protein
MLDASMIAAALASVKYLFWLFGSGSSASSDVVLSVRFTSYKYRPEPMKDVAFTDPKTFSWYVLSMYVYSMFSRELVNGVVIILKSDTYKLPVFVAEPSLFV